MRFVLLLVLVALAGCGRRTEGSMPKIPVSRGKAAAVAMKAGTTIADSRRELAAKGVEFFDLALDGAAPLRVSSLEAREIDDVRVLVNVRMKATGTTIGLTTVADPASVVSATQTFAKAPAVVYVVRFDDAVKVEDAVALLTALRRATSAPIALSPASSDEAVPNWNECPFPVQADLEEVDSGKALLHFELDAASRPGVVYVLETTEPGFAGAAALCASRRPSSSGAARKLTMKFVRGK